MRLCVLCCVREYTDEGCNRWCRAAEAFAELHPELLLPLLEETMQIVGQSLCDTFNGSGDVEQLSVSL